VLAPARTFGFLEDVEAMRSKGLIKGASLENAVVLDADAGVLNPEGLRFPDEFVRHKALDIVGDLSLVGYPLVGRYVAFKPGHALNVMAIERLRDIQGAFVIQDLDHPRASADSPLLVAAMS
jgi:UDP-3-O-[3-hydroxymyristoyl] N-acetylglucosamine deacetylase